MNNTLIKNLTFAGMITGFFIPAEPGAIPFFSTLTCVAILLGGFFIIKNFVIKEIAMKLSAGLALLAFVNFVFTGVLFSLATAILFAYSAYAMSTKYKAHKLSLTRKTKPTTKMNSELKIVEFRREAINHLEDPNLLVLNEPAQVKIAALEMMFDDLHSRNSKIKNVLIESRATDIAELRTRIHYLLDSIDLHEVTPGEVDLLKPIPSIINVNYDKILFAHKFLGYDNSVDFLNTDTEEREKIVNTYKTLIADLEDYLSLNTTIIDSAYDIKNEMEFDSIRDSLKMQEVIHLRLYKHRYMEVALKLKERTTELNMEKELHERTKRKVKELELKLAEKEGN